MKKILKKATVFMCALAVSIGAIGGSADAASYMDKKAVDVYVYLNKVALPLNDAYVSVSTSNGTSKEVFMRGNGKTSKMRVKVSAATKTSDVKFTVRYRIAGQTKVSSRSITYKASEVYSLLGGKNIHINAYGDNCGEIKSLSKR